MDDKTDYPDLTRQQQVMLLLFAKGKAGLAEIANELPGGGKMQTVQTLLNALMKKGLVTREFEGGTYVYSPTVSQKKALRSHLGQILTAFTNNSGVKLLRSLLAFGFISHADLKDTLDDSNSKNQP